MLVQGPRYWTTGGLAPARPAPALAPHERATALLWVETVTVAIVLLLLSAALIGRLGNPDGVSEPPAWLRLMWLPVYAVVFAILGWRLPRLPRVWLAALTLLPIIGWTVASAQWSLEPDITQRRTIALVVPTLFALFLAARYDWRGLLRLIAWVSLILAGGSLLAAVAVPSFGVDHGVHVGAWKGLFFEKNALGGFMVRGALACLCVMTFTPERWWFWLGGALLCGFLVVMSTSTTAILGLLAVFAGFAAICFLRRGPIHAVAGLWLAVAAGIVVLVAFAIDPDMFFNAVGKDSSLTGRTNIWAALLRQVAHRPWEGFGYGAFWRSAPNGPAAWVAKEADWPVLAADNAWAEILVQLGWTGVILFALTLAAFIPLALVSLFRRGPGGLWATLFLTTLMMTTITESVLLKQNDLTWVLYVATLGKLMQGREPESDQWT